MRRTYPTYGAPVVLAVLFSFGLLAGCETSVDPIIGSEYPYTIWGFMNSGADTQYVRIFPISDEIITDRDDVIDAEVYSTNLTTGEHRKWSHELVTFDSLTSGHVYWSPFRAINDHEYRLEVVRSDGVTSHVEVRVPSEADVQIDASGSITFPVRITGDIPNLVGPRVTYEAINVPPAAGNPNFPVHPPVVLEVSVPYDDFASPVPGGWHFVINMVRDTTTVFDEFRAGCLINALNPDVWLRSIEFTAVVADSSWAPPGGSFDPDLLAVPGTMSNVENGYGFFGAGQGIRFLWTPSVEARRLAGYNFEGRCSTLNPSPACLAPPIPCLGERVQDIWQLYLR